MDENFVFESPDVLWVRNINNGMFRVEIDTLNYKVMDKRLYNQDNGFTSLNGLYVHKIRDKVCFSTLTGLFEYDPVNDKIIPYTDFDIFFPDDHAYTFIEEINNNIYALSLNIVQVAGFTNNGYYTGTNFFPFNNIQIDFIKYYETMTVVNDTLTIIPNEHGFALLNTTISNDNLIRIYL
ncbi:MAG: hypothetical protein LUD02_03250 [Tannerellaceae bacterium]|nr:hypothetical protein [Tannerellaceae bacterium]